jgi:hypothetical protein
LKKGAYQLPLLLIACLLSGIASAEPTKVFELHNGETITGVVIDEGERGFFVRDAEGKLHRLKYEEIRDIRLAEVTETGEPLLIAEPDEPGQSPTPAPDSLDSPQPEVQEVNLLGLQGGALLEPQDDDLFETQERPPDKDSPTGLVEEPTQEPETPWGHQQPTPIRVISIPGTKDQASAVLVRPGAGQSLFAVYGSTTFTSTHLSTWEAHTWWHVNAEALVTSNWAISFGYNQVLEVYDQDLSPAVELRVHFLSHADAHHHLEGAIAIWYMLRKGSIYPMPFVGYRYQKPGGGPVARLGVLLTVPSASVGWSF